MWLELRHSFFKLEYLLVFKIMDQINILFIRTLSTVKRHESLKISFSTKS